MADYRLFPEILPGADDEFIDTTYTAGELEKKDYQELSSIAAAHPSDDVHGRMAKQDLRESLEGLERLGQVE